MISFHVPATKCLLEPGIRSAKLSEQKSPLRAGNGTAGDTKKGNF